MQQGQRIGRYVLREQIGRGGMAEIFKADENLSDGGLRTVAIKRLFPKLSADREFVSMFINEARIASSMQHPNIVQTYDLMNYGSYYYIVMEYLEGLDLEELFNQTPPGGMVAPMEEIAYVTHEVAKGLAYAHAGGARPEDGPVVHRDISPGNILIGCNGKVSITDFGIARALQYASYTRPGVLKGKHEYMAPEYVQGKNFDGRADLFSLGVVLYELLTGKNPFTGLLPGDTWERIVNHEPPQPSQVVPSVPKNMDAILARALSKNPEQRYPTGEEMASDLVSFFSEMGRQKVASALGIRVVQAMSKTAPSATGYDVDIFPSPDGRGADRTQEVHLDELLDLVEPARVPEPLLEEEYQQSTVSLARSSQVDRSRKWKGWLSLVAVLLLVIGGGLLFWLWPRPVGYLWVDSAPTAEVYVDGRPVGFTPLQKHPLPEGSYLVEVRKLGAKKSRHYRRAIEEGKDTEIQVKWKRKSSIRSAKKRSRRRP